MTDPITVAGAAIGSKKLFGIVGMAALSSEKIVEGLPLLLVIAVPLMTAAYFVGATAKEIENINTTIKDNNVVMRAYVDSSVAEDKWKTNYVYTQATQGKRFTAADGERHDARISKLEKSAQGHSRFEDEGKRLEKRIEKCEAKINGGN